MDKKMIEINNHIKFIEKEIKLLSDKFKASLNLDNVKKDNFENKIQSIAKRYPIKNHPLDMEDEYTIRMYLTLLLTIDRVTGNNIEDSTKLYISRLIEGLSLKLDIDDLIKLSLKLDYKIIDEFTIILSKKDLNINFAVDSIIIINLSNIKDKRKINYLSNLYELINIKENQVEEIVELANLICSKDKKSYKEFCCKELNINLENFIFYTREFVDGIICKNSELIYILNNSSEIIKDKVLKSKKVILENLSIESIDKFPSIEKSQYIKIKKCMFENFKNSINLKKNNKIIIEKCKFKKFTDRALYCDENETIEIYESYFESCRHECKDTYSYGFQASAYGGAIYSNNMKKLKIENCNFENCNTYHYEKGKANGAVAYLSNIDKIFLINTRFKDCMNYSWKYGSHWDEVGQLFELYNIENTQVNKCVRINSCKNGIENTWGEQSW